MEGYKGVAGMKNFKTYKDFLAYHRKKSLEYYHKMMADPVKAEVYRAKRRVYEKKRYHEQMAALKNRG